MSNKPREWYVIKDGPQEVMRETKPPNEECFKVMEVIEEENRTSQELTHKADSQ